LPGEGSAHDLGIRITFCPQVVLDVVEGPVIARSCELKCALKCGRVLIHGAEHTRPGTAARLAKLDEDEKS
jgi:hypothetical protein